MGPIKSETFTVSILTRPGGRVLRARGRRGCGRRSSFNPHPARGPGAAGPTWRGLINGVPVSILTRPGGRVLPQPSSDHPRAALAVSILTRPGGRVLPGRPRPPASERVVSILTRPGGRVLPAQPLNVGMALSVSILTRPGGRVLLDRDRHVLGVVEVSILTRPGGRVLPVLILDGAAAGAVVSILTRPGGRVLPPRRSNHTQGEPCFNPHPARGPGAALRSVLGWVPLPNFSPNFGPRRSRCRARESLTAHCRSVCTHLSDGGARMSGRMVVADGSHIWRIQKTSGPRWSNDGRVPNVSEWRVSGSRRR